MNIVYFRDDDLGYVTPYLEAFLNIFSEYEVPLNLEAIPARCYQNKELFYLLAPYLETGLFEIHQHGVSHLPYSERYELSDDQTEEAVEKDLILGKKVLTEIFGEYFKPYYTPPWNHLNPKFKEIINKHFLNDALFKTHINLGYKTGETISQGYSFKKASELIKEYEELKDKSVVGVLIHHDLYKHSNDLTELHLFIGYLISKGVEFKKFSELKP